MAAFYRQPVPSVFTFCESRGSRTFWENCLFGIRPSSYADATRAVFCSDAPDYWAVNVFVMAGAVLFADGASERRTGAVGEVVCASRPK